jgi:hypothetical protein
MSRIPTKKPETRHQDYAAQVERLAAAKAELQAIEHQRSLAGTGASRSFSPAIQEKKIAICEAQLALEQDAAAYNRAAPDLEAIRGYVLDELALYSAVIEAPTPTPPAPLAEATPEAMRAHVDAVLAYRAAYAAHQAAIAPAGDRLKYAYDAARAAQQIVYAARKAANLPAPKAVIVGRPQGAPGTRAGVAEDVEAIEGQRVPPPGKGMNHVELQLQQLRADLAQWETAQAEAAEAERIANLPAPERRREVERLRFAAEAAR